MCHFTGPVLTSLYSLSWDYMMLFHMWTGWGEAAGRSHVLSAPSVAVGISCAGCISEQNVSQGPPGEKHVTCMAASACGEFAAFSPCPCSAESSLLLVTVLLLVQAADSQQSWSSGAPISHLLLRCVFLRGEELAVAMNYIDLANTLFFKQYLKPASEAVMFNSTWCMWELDVWGIFGE